MTARTIAYGVLLVLFAAICIGVQTIKDPVYAYDGYNYSIRAQVDAGIPYETARAAARERYAGTPALRAPAAIQWTAAPYPQYWHLFASRAIYPWLSSVLWHALGFRSLFVVSNVAFVLSVAMLYLLLLNFAQDGVAATIALLIAILPECRLLGRSDLTDMTAFLFWCATLLAMIRYARTGSSAWLAAFAVACTLLTFTRPVPYLPLFSGLALVAAGVLLRERIAMLRGAVMSGISFVLCAVLLAVSSYEGAPGTMDVLRGLQAQAGATELTLRAWYTHALLVTTSDALTWFALSVVAPIAVIALAINARRYDVAVLLGALVSTFPTLVLNPIDSDVPRVIVFPMLPIVACGLAIVLRRGFADLRAPVMVADAASASSDGIEHDSHVPAGAVTT